MRQFEIHMPERTAKKLSDQFNADGQRDCGHGMVIVEFDELGRAEEGLRLARGDAEFLSEIYPVRGL
jgi:glycine cleavage system aminomethyltransferase T